MNKVPVTKELEQSNPYIYVFKAATQSSINGDVQITGLGARPTANGESPSFSNDTVTINRTGLYSVRMQGVCNVLDSGVVLAIAINGGLPGGITLMAGQSAINRDIMFCGFGDLDLNEGDEVTFFLQAALVRDVQDFRFSLEWKGE